jgi:UDP-N-acetylglucosamine 2-epimerase (non-hydrolysing)
MSLICNVVGARPNFMKMGPVILEARRRGLSQITVHTGQHYDAQMSAVFFHDLGMPQPDIDLEIGAGSHANQTARVMIAFEKVCLEQKPDLVVVGGDVNSTLACALTAAKLCIPVAHVESGLRSFDHSMPEEINRVLTDHIASLLFTTEQTGNENLLREGIEPERIHFVGNPMIDSLQSHIAAALANKPWERFLLVPAQFGLVTLHRPSNVDNVSVFSEIAEALIEISDSIPLIFPVHPRTRQRIQQFGINLNPIKRVEPLGYLDFLGLMAKARLVITDSGGIQEETTALGVRCLTLRLNTERPITLEYGTNRLVGLSKQQLVEAAREVIYLAKEDGALPLLWDGRAAYRIVDAMQDFLEIARSENGNNRDVSQTTLEL